MNVSVFGLGYVGTVSAACFAHHGHRVIGVDPQDHKVAAINRGVSPIVEPGLDALLGAAKASGRLSATMSAQDAVFGSDVSLLCVGTPSNPNGSLNLDYIFRVAEQIGDALRAKQSFHGVVIRSTVLPGTVRHASAVIAERSGRVPGRDFAVASNPEFLREGTSVEDFERPPFTVIGADNDRLATMLRELYARVEAPLHIVRIEEAEILKYACNTFHAVKVTFANEIGAICKKLGIDSHEVMRIFVQDQKLNISAYYLKPGFAFGGSCLPKDVRALTYQARALDLASPFLQSLMPSNEDQIARVVSWVVGQRKKSVGVLGLSFKKDTDDLRESPIVAVVEALIGKGFNLAVFDANVNLSKLVGANRSYIEQEIPHISQLMRPSLEEVLAHADVILVANRAPEFRHVLRHLRQGQVVLDLVRIVDTAQKTAGRYEGIAW